MSRDGLNPQCPQQLLTASKLHLTGLLSGLGDLTKAFTAGGSMLNQLEGSMLPRKAQSLYVNYSDAASQNVH